MGLLNFSSATHKASMLEMHSKKCPLPLLDFSKKKKKKKKPKDEEAEDEPPVRARRLPGAGAADARAIGLKGGACGAVAGKGGRSGRQQHAVGAFLLPSVMQTSRQDDAIRADTRFALGSGCGAPRAFFPTRAGLAPTRPPHGCDASRSSSSARRAPPSCVRRGSSTPFSTGRSS